MTPCPQMGVLGGYFEVKTDKTKLTY